MADSPNPKAAPAAPKPTETGAAKIAQAQQVEVQSVIDTNPTEAGATIPTAGTREGTVVVGRDDDVQEALYDETSNETLVELKADVVETFYFPDSRRPSYRLLYTKGQVVAKGLLEAHNESVRVAKIHRERAAKGEVDPLNPAGIDGTTLASGTYSVAETTDKAGELLKSGSARQ